MGSRRSCSARALLVPLRRAGPPGPLAAIPLLLSAACGGLQPVPEPPSPDRIPELRAEVDENPGAVQSRVRLGAAFREADSLQSARRVLTEARRLDPKNPAAALFLGLTHEDLERYGDAREVYRDFLAASGASDLRERIEQRLTYLERRQLEASVRAALAREDELADRPPREGTVAVLPFLYQGASAELEPLSRALASFLVTDLSQTDRLTVLERVRVQLLLDEMELAESRYVDPATAVRSGRLLGAASMVAGRLGGDRDELSVEASLVDVARGAGGARRVLSSRRSTEQIFEMEDELALSVFDALGIELTPAERERVTGDPTDDFEALLAYGRGLMAEDAANFSEAARHYQQAAQIDPDFEAAQQRAEAASDISAASEVGTDELAQAASETSGDRGGGAGDAQAMVETAGADAGDAADRDAVAETLGLEGATPTALIRILIPPPGEGQ